MPSCEESICVCASTKVEDRTCTRDMRLLGKSLHTVIWVKVSVPCFNFSQVSNNMLSSTWLSWLWRTNHCHKHLHLVTITWIPSIACDFLFFCDCRLSDLLRTYCSEDVCYKRIEGCHTLRFKDHSKFNNFRPPLTGDICIDGFWVSYQLWTPDVRVQLDVSPCAPTRLITSCITTKSGDPPGCEQGQYRRAQ